MNTTTNLELNLPEGTDFYNIDDLNDNFEKIDTLVGESPNIGVSPGLNSHTEGYRVKATGIVAHAEGSETEATGNYSHAEGRDTTASGDYSHAGGKNTVAAYDYQTAIGKYNENKSTNLFEIGNGDSTNPSNAFEVSEDGDVTAAKEITDGFGNRLSDKVDSVAGKGLSTNDYTTAEKNKLSGINPSNYVKTSGNSSIDTGTLDIINGNGKAFKISNGTQAIGLHIGTGGINRGIYDFNTAYNDWILYRDNNRNIYLNQSGSASVNANVYMGNSADGIYYSSTGKAFCPQTNAGAKLGISSKRWSEVHATTMYENGTSLASKYQAAGNYAKIVASSANDTTPVTVNLTNQLTSDVGLFLISCVTTASSATTTENSIYYVSIHKINSTTYKCITTQIAKGTNAPSISVSGGYVTITPQGTGSSTFNPMAYSCVKLL